MYGHGHLRPRWFMDAYDAESHITRTAGWLPPAECWPLEPQEAEDPLPYGWEQALDIRGKPYYI
ncbi:hypothetical protein JYU34_017335, partial [Plutella xylostella]